MKRFISLLSIFSLMVAGPSAAQMSIEQAKQEGNALGKAMRSDKSLIPTNEGQAEMVPGYSGTTLEQTDYYKNPDKMVADGKTAKGTSEAYEIATDAKGSRPTFSAEEIKEATNKAMQIETNPEDHLGGEQISGAEGSCTPLPAEEHQAYYDATCDTGVVVNSIPSDTLYSCPSGWQLNGQSCTRVEIIDATVSYSCNADYTLVGTQCSKVQAANISAYSCPAGWTLNGSNCTRQLSQAAQQNGYSCPNGWSLAGSVCQQTASQAATPTYSCPANYSLSGTTCTRNFSTDATANYSCPTGWSLAGTLCSRTVTIPATENYSCPEGQSFNGGQCVLSTTYGATPTYSCPSGGSLYDFVCRNWVQVPKNSVLDCSHIKNHPYGTHFGPQVVFNSPNPTAYCGYWLMVNDNRNKSCKTINGYAPAFQKERDSVMIYRTCGYQALYIKNCPSGTTDIGGDMCQKVEDYTPTTEYTCPEGGNLNGVTCSKEDRSQPNVTHSCPSGYNLSGNQCVKSESQSADISYSCPSGGTLSGTRCNLSETIAANLSYACPTGWALAGTMCNRTDSQPASPVYACPTGYSLSGTTCSRDETQPATPIYSCPTGFVLEGTQCRATVPAIPNYFCPESFDLSGTQCSRTLTQPGTSYQQCPEGSQTQADGSCTREDAKDDCSALQSNAQCQWLYDNCLDEEGNAQACKMTERVFRCPIPGEKIKTPPKYVCGDDVYCINGNCEPIAREASTEFQDALVALNAIDQGSKEFDPDNFQLFSGKRDTCHKPIFGLVDCCAGRVSGLLPLGVGGAALTGAISGNVALLAGVATQYLTTFMCSTDEKMLDVKDRMGMCHFIGSYCSSSILGVCKTKRKTYCCFESKLSRVLQVQGRPQIGKAWGAPKSEQCIGFTIDEFSQLDLSKMDFTEVYSDFVDAVKLPSEAQTLMTIQSKIQGYYDLHTTGQ